MTLTTYKPSFLNNSSLLNYFFAGTPLQSAFHDADTSCCSNTATAPAINVRETDEAYLMEVAAPGLNKEDFSIRVRHGILHIGFDKTEHSKEAGHVLHEEFNQRQWNRQFTLPKEKVNVDQIDASYKEGILHITLPKQEEVKASAKTIQVS